MMASTSSCSSRRPFRSPARSVRRSIRWRSSKASPSSWPDIARPKGRLRPSSRAMDGRKRPDVRPSTTSFPAEIKTWMPGTSPGMTNAKNQCEETMLGHNTKMTGAQCLADMLKGYGVSHVFMVPAVLRRTFAEMERRTDIKRIHTHGEKSAAYMADGYARASGRPGVCMAQVIGALNLAAGLRDAHLAHSPVIAFTGGREPKTKFRKVYQEVDDVPAFAPVTKFNATMH